MKKGSPRLAQGASGAASIPRTSAALFPVLSPCHRWRTPSGEAHAADGGGGALYRGGFRRLGQQVGWCIGARWAKDPGDRRQTSRPHMGVAAATGVVAGWGCVGGGCQAWYCPDPAVWIQGSPAVVGPVILRAP
jgi:hypothetical protein